MLCFVCLTLPVYLGSPRYMVGSVLLILLVFYVVLSCVSVYCVVLVYSISGLSFLDCAFEFSLAHGV